MESISNSYVAVQNTAVVNPADTTSQAQAQQDIADLQAAYSNAVNSYLNAIRGAVNQAALEGVDLTSQLEAAEETISRANADLTTATTFLKEGVEEGNPEYFDAVASLTGPNITALNNLGTVAAQVQATANSNAPNPGDPNQLSKAQSLSSAAAAQSANDLSKLQALVNANPGNSTLETLLSYATNENNNVVKYNGTAQDTTHNGTQTCIEYANSTVVGAAYVRTLLQEAISDVS